MREESGRWFVYLVRCRDGSLYTGISTDPVARVRAHNAGRGAKYTGARRPVTLVHTETAESRPAALRREHAIKRWSRAGKEQLLMARQRKETPVKGFRGFGPGAFTFLRRLRRNNNREWFATQREVYEKEVLSPMRALVEEMDDLFRGFAPEITGDPKKSIFRIHRDVRFSKDKSPYKTHAACWFYHQDAGRGVGSEATEGGAGFYFHLSPEECLIAGGIWMPPKPSLSKIREAIANDPDTFGRIVEDRAFRRRFNSLDEDAMLKRLPAGFAPGHPAERWLRYQTFTCSRDLSTREVLSPALPLNLAKDFARLLPLVRFLNSALGYPPARFRPPRLPEDDLPPRIAQSFRAGRPRS